MEHFFKKVLCAHYKALQWNSAKIPSSLLLDPKHYGLKWDIEMQLHEAVMTNIAVSTQS